MFKYAAVILVFGATIYAAEPEKNKPQFEVGQMVKIGTYYYGKVSSIYDQSIVVELNNGKQASINAQTNILKKLTQAEIEQLKSEGCLEFSPY